MYMMDRPARVLVIEAEAEARAVLLELLEGAGLGADSAADGAESLRLFHATQPQAVLLGLDLPGLDGWEVLRRIRELSDAPVLVLADRESEVSKVRALRAGADDYMVKPVNRVEALARIEALLRRETPGAPRLFYP